MNKLKSYKYIGSTEIKLSVAEYPCGTVIRSIADLENWIIGQLYRPIITGGSIVATFVIDLDVNLCIADRHSEHVACASARSVLSAGEIFINWDKNGFEVSDITNQSTGYCPKLESWHYVEAALDKIPIDRPSHFTSEFTFRRCNACLQINIIKDSLFVCAVCSSILPDVWNFE
jgi:hypothetical protein